MKGGSMEHIKCGCHGSTLELDYDKETDYLDHIVSVVKQAVLKESMCKFLC